MHPAHRTVTAFRILEKAASEKRAKNADRAYERRLFMRRYLSSSSDYIIDARLSLKNPRLEISFEIPYRLCALSIKQYALFVPQHDIKLKITI